MRTETPANRSSAVTATTLVALVAMAATTSALALPRGMQHHLEGRMALTDGQAVRTVAAAVVAAARDLFGADRGEVTFPGLLWPDEYEFSSAPVARISPVDSHRPRYVLLREDLLDLPPPSC